MKRAALALCLFIVLLAPIVSLSQSTIVLANTEPSIAKPSVPEFTVKIVDRSYDGSWIDPNTGQNVSRPGYHVENYTIDVTIKNQPFTSYWVMEGVANWTVYFYYNVRFKRHYSGDWMNAYSPSNTYPKQSNSTYTVLTYTHSSDNEWFLGGIMPVLTPGTQIDFQVQALIGYVHRVYNPDATDQLQMWPWVFTGETSGWSSTQTITIPDSSTPSSSPASSMEPTQSPEPQQTEPFPTLPLVTASIAIAAVAAVSVLVYFKKRKHEVEPP